jgi:hypothetical protein
MKKELLKVLLGTLIIFLIWSPFLMPDNWVYVQKNKSVYDSNWEAIALISLLFLAFFAGLGVKSMFDKLIK